MKWLAKAPFAQIKFFSFMLFSVNRAPIITHAMKDYYEMLFYYFVNSVISSHTFDVLQDNLMKKKKKKKN